MKDFKGWNYDGWSNMAKVVYKRTYARKKEKGSDILEDWPDTSYRSIMGSIKLVDKKFIKDDEQKKLFKYYMERKATSAGRGLWIGGTDFVDKVGGAALNNCWFLTASNWNNYVISQDLLMLGGGVGMSVEHRFVSKLPPVIDSDIAIEHKATNDADFIVPDSREGWCKLTYKVLESFFETGESFTFSTVCLRGAGEAISGFGGTASGPLPLVNFIKELTSILTSRKGKHIRPIDAADILCSIANMVVAGNVRRSALMILGDPWDKEFLTIKRWDIEGNRIPSYRYRANFSVIADDYSDLHPLFWDSYNVGEPIGIFNRKNAQKYGRMGEEKPDSCIGVNPCAEATLEEGEPCNLYEIYLSRVKSEQELVDICRLVTRAAIRTTCAFYHHEVTQKVISKNRRIGIGLTGILNAKLYTKASLDLAYSTVKKEAEMYCAEMGIPNCVRLTVIKPSGTLGKLGDCLEGCHPAYSRYMIQRIRFSSDDGLLPELKAAGHYMEMEKNQDGSPKPESTVVDFYLDNGENTPCADTGFNTTKQLDTLLDLQKHWADQAVSITVYYEKEKLDVIKKWIKDNLKNIKSISFLLHQGHGFIQAPKEPITKERYQELTQPVKSINVSNVKESSELDSSDCEGGACPVR